MTSRQWRNLLTSWSAHLLAADLIQQLDPADRDLKYLGFPPAPAFAIHSLESKLGVKLPPSYCAFLEASDGFRAISPSINRLRSTTEVDWFRVENQGWIETYNEPSIYDDPDRPEPSDEDYFDYSAANELNFRRHHLFEMLQVSDVNDGVMLLNPLVVTPDGEWEAWFFADWIPGANRYASFGHMMVETYRSLHKLGILSGKTKLPRIKIPGPEIPRHGVTKATEISAPGGDRKKRKKGQSEIDFVAQFVADLSTEEITPAPADLVKLLNDLNHRDSKVRGKTVRMLQGKLKIRGMSTRHPDLVPLAAQLASSLPDPESRCACVSLLTNITPDGPVPAWLTTALTDPHPWVLQTGLYAVHYFSGPALVVPIVKILSENDDMQLLQSAATALSEIPDLRAVPALVARLEATPPLEARVPPEAVEQVLEWHYVSIAIALARYGGHALSHLLALLAHPDPNRRIAAIVALRTIGNSDSHPAVVKLKSDPNAGVRRQADLCDRIWGNSPGFELHALS